MKYYCDKNNRDDDEGLLYCLVNDAMPGLVKIGMTTRTVTDRMRELYSTGVPLPFKCIRARRVCGVHLKEKLVHSVLSHYRVDVRREFFSVPPDKVNDLFDLIEGQDEEDHEDELLQVTNRVRWGLKWSQEEESNMLCAVGGGKSHEDVAHALRRSVGGVRSRLLVVAVRMVEESNAMLCVAAHATKTPMFEIARALKERGGRRG